MASWVWILLGLFVALFVVLLMALMKVSSRSSRRDEAYYVLHPPDGFRKAVMNTDGNTATQGHMDTDPTANRCVCCGEIIPEGLQVCANCEQRIKKPDAWW